MQCFEAQRSIRLFIKEVLQEEHRDALRTHLLHCPECQKKLSDLDPVTEGLLQLSQLTAPYQFTEAMLHPSAIKSQRFTSRSPAATRSKSKFSFETIVFVIGGFFLVLFLFVWHGVVQYKNEQKKPLYMRIKGRVVSHFKSSNGKPSSASRKYVTSDGRTIYIDLSGLTITLPPPAAAEKNPPSPEAPLTKGPNVVIVGFPKIIRLDTDFSPPENNDHRKPVKSVDILQPLHFHLNFQDDPARQRFLTLAQKFSDQTEWNSHDLLIAAFTQSNLNAFLAETNSEPGLSELQKQLGPETLPFFKNPLPISFVLNISGERPSPNAILEWHLKFNLSNQLVFKEKLQAAGFHFLQENKDLWLLELTADQFVELIRLKSECPGLAIEGGARPLPETDTLPPILKLALYLLPS